MESRSKIEDLNVNEPRSKTTTTRSISTLNAGDVKWYRICDFLSGILILSTLVFSPWAFGSAQRWAVWTMSATGYALGALLLVKIFLRRARGCFAPRWEHFSPHSGTLSRRRHPVVRRLTRALAWLTLAVLGECLAGALNAAADRKVETQVFEYHPFLTWLPHSFDGHRTWFYFWMYIGLAGSFWAVADWLGGLTSTEDRQFLNRRRNSPATPPPAPPGRVRLLLWVLCLNGTCLAVEGIVQRAAGSNQLLFFDQPRVNPDCLAQFGPFAYRSNAAEYFNLLWPLCLGFWLTLRRATTTRHQNHAWLLLGAAIMAACPFICSSRGGSFVDAGMLLLTFTYLGCSFAGRGNATNHRFTRSVRQPLLEEKPARAGAIRPPVAGVLEAQTQGSAPALSDQEANADERAQTKTEQDGGTPRLVLIFLTAILVMGWFFGWKSLAPRMVELETKADSYEIRKELYLAAEPIANNYPLFGTGPGTFASVFQLYRLSYGEDWPEQLHNDWLETRITFGWLGLGLLLTALAIVGLRGFLPGGIGGCQPLIVLAWIGLAGCLVHARFDFPLQLHSILLLFLVICALLFNLSDSSSASQR
jgi:hypothetical protein